MLNVTALLAGVVSNLVPEMDTDVFDVPIVGVKLVMVGTVEAVTVNEAPLVIDALGVVIAIDPVVAPDGTVVTILVVLAEVTVAATPLKVTVF